MRKLALRIGSMICIGAFVDVAAAQTVQQQLYNQVAPPSPRSYTIQTPGQMPTHVSPLGNDSYLVQTPGQTPSTVSPLGNGRYVIRTPGQSPTFIDQEE
jgi:hypothetical protein